MTRTEVKELIDHIVKANGTGAITGALLNSVITALNANALNASSDRHIFGLKPHNPTASYDAGQAFLHNGYLYISLKAQSGEFEALSKQRVGGALTFVPDSDIFNPEAEYEEGDYVIFEGATYRANDTVSGVTPPDDKFDKVVFVVEYGQEWEENTYAFKHNVVFHEDAYYVATEEMFSLDFTEELALGKWLPIAVPLPRCIHLIAEGNTALKQHKNWRICAESNGNLTFNKCSPAEEWVEQFRID